MHDTVVVYLLKHFLSQWNKCGGREREEATVSRGKEKRGEVNWKEKNKKGINVKIYNSK